MAERKTVQELNERLALVQESHERAVALRNRIAEHIGQEGIRTNRHPGRDEQHIEIDLEVAYRIAERLNALEDIDFLLSAVLPE